MGSLVANFDGYQLGYLARYYSRRGAIASVGLNDVRTSLCIYTVHFDVNRLVNLRLLSVGTLLSGPYRAH